MPLRRRAWLTLEGWYYLAVLAFIIGGAVLRSVNLLVVLAGTMIAPPLFNWRLVMASLTGLSVRRHLPPQAMSGMPLTVEVEIENSRAWMSSWLLTVEDWVLRVGRDDAEKALEKFGPTAAPGRLWRRLLQGRAALYDRALRRANRIKATALISHVPTRGSARGTYRITIHRRGRYRFGPLRISTRFPLGLVRGQVTTPAAAELIVAPRVGRFLAAWGQLLEAEMAGEERRHPQRGISEGDYYGLRPWQSGDSLRWVHWRTTAKLARPMVRQFERRKSREVAIVLDPWLASPDDRAEGLAELAISLAATAIYDIASRGHSQLTVAIGGHKPHCYSGPASAVFCEELLERLADLLPAQGYGLGQTLDEALAAAPRGARMIVISARSADDPALSASRADLPLDPDDLVWIDTGSEAIDRLFTLD